MVDIHNLKKEDIKKEISNMKDIDPEHKRRAIDSLGDSRLVQKLIQDFIGSQVAYQDKDLLKDEYEELRWLLKVSLDAK